LPNQSCKPAGTKLGFERYDTQIKD
jgi:hypothetical protein